MVDPRMDTKSWALYGDSQVAPAEWLRQCWQWALAGSDEDATVSAQRQAEINPTFGRWDDPALKGMRAQVVLGRCDPMFEEGLALAKRMESAGLQVQVVQAA